MAVQIGGFLKRRVLNTTALVVAAIACLLLWRVLEVSLRPHAFYSGIALLVLVLILTLFNARKKLPFLPLIKASHWLQFHIYAGFLSLLLYALHTSFRVPNGNLEIALAVLFLVVTASGVIGLLITRLLPRMMSASGETLTFEKIPAYELRLRSEVETLIEETESTTGASALGDAYIKHLSGYFRPRSAIRFFMGNPFRFRDRALNEIDDIERYTNEDEQAAIARIRELVYTKHNLDVQKSCQWFLRCWLFIHIPFTYSMVIVALVHAWIAFTYTTSR